MDKLKKITVFFVVPLLIVGLLILNANLQAQKYNNDNNELNQYSAEIASNVDKVNAKVSEVINIPLTIKNIGTMNWLKDSENSINLSYKLLDEDLEIILSDGLRTNLTKSVRSGESIYMDAVVEVPNKLGTYYVEFDMVHEGVTWFEDKGSNTLKIKLEVK